MLVVVIFIFPSGRYCGTEIPHPVTSFSNALVVNFVSDSSVAVKGFRATYTGSTSSNASISGTQWLCHIRS